MTQPPDTTYLQQRLTALGITAEQNTFIRKWVTDVDEKQPKAQQS